MGAGTAIYGVTSDGSVSRCRAKDPAHCRYHRNDDGTTAKHMQLTESQANAMNEAAARANAMPEANSLQRAAKSDAQGFVKSMTFGLDAMDGEKAYDRAMEALKAMDSLEDDDRVPVENVDELLPRPKSMPRSVAKNDSWGRIAATEDIYEKEISDLREQSWNLTGRKLVGGEERMIADRLKEYADRDLFRQCTQHHQSSDPSPAEEQALLLLTSNPAASSEVMNELAGNEKIMKFGAKFIESSPYADAAAKEKAFRANPANALESPMIDPEYVDSALEAATKDPANNLDVLEAALHNPQASPDKAYESYRRLSKSEDVTPAQLKHLDWQMSLNPNTEFRRRVAELDADGDMQVTKYWYKWSLDSEDE